MRLNLVAHVVGLLLRAFGASLIIPMVVDWGYGNWHESVGFLIAAIASVVFGEVARRQYAKGTELHRLEGIAVVASSWLVVSVFAAIPYVWSGLSVIDGLFESMSGLTTTGATIFTDFGAFSEGIFLWRSMTQWFGGMGVIALFIAVLPRLGIAGRQLFFAEAPGPEEDRLTPRIRHTAIALWSIYAGLTATMIAALVGAGMPVFDAVCNALTTLPAGGFSPHPQSIGGYGNANAEWIFIAFMFLAGANFSLQYRALRGRPGSLFRDEEFRTYTIIVVLGTLLLTYTLLPFNSAPPQEYLEGGTLNLLNGDPPTTVLRHAAFQILTVLTTAGFASDDFNLWNDSSRTILLMLMFIGGSAGSSAGGPKIVRALLIFKYATTELVRALHPQAITTVRFNRRVVPQRILRAIVSFLLLYLLIFSASVLALAALGADVMVAITASIATLGNIGPGFGIIGPMGTYASLPTASKVILFLNMWVGRLEVMTVLVLLQPGAWRSARWDE